MDSIAHQVAERGIDLALALDTVEAGECGTFDRQREVAFATRIMAGMADMMIALVLKLEAGRIERSGKPLDHFACNWTGGSGAHRVYIGAMATKASKWHGRVEGASVRCSASGCREPGEFRAPLTPGDFDGPGTWRWFCLEHVRVHNARYNFFEGMSTEEIEAAQSPIAGWERATRAFATNGADAGPAWREFADPLDAISARFQPETRRQRVDRFTAKERHALGELGLKDNADRTALRKRYSELVRRYHPDRNGGDRSHEKKLVQVIDAYQLLKGSRAFAATDQR
jgi:hypothetical protein